MFISALWPFLPKHVSSASAAYFHTRFYLSLSRPVCLEDFEVQRCGNNVTFVCLNSKEYRFSLRNIFCLNSMEYHGIITFLKESLLKLFKRNMPVHVNQQNLRLLIKTDFLFNEFLMLNLSFHHAVSYSNVCVCVCVCGGREGRGKQAWTSGRRCAMGKIW